MNRMKNAAFLCVGLMSLASAARAGNNLAAVSSADGRVEVFYANGVGPGNHGIYHSWQSQEGWASWRVYQPAPDPHAPIVAGRDRLGRVFVAWLSGGSIWFAGSETPGAGLFAPRRLETTGLRSLELATNEDGRLELFALDGQGRAWAIPQATLGSWDWGPSRFLHGHDLKQISAASYRDGRIGLAALGGDGKVYLTSQIGPNLGWGNWESLEGRDVAGVAAGANADRRLEVAAVGRDGILYHRYEIPEGGWSDWVSLRGNALSDQIVSTRNADQRMEIVGVRNGVVAHTWQLSANGGWREEPSDLPGFDPVSEFAVAQHANDGRLAVVAATSTAAVAYARQLSPNAGFSGWQALPLLATTGPPSPPPPGDEDVPAGQDVPVGLGLAYRDTWRLDQGYEPFDFEVTFTGRWVSGIGAVGTTTFSVTARQHLSQNGNFNVTAQVDGLRRGLWDITATPAPGLLTFWDVRTCPGVSVPTLVAVLARDPFTGQTLCQ